MESLSYQAIQDVIQDMQRWKDDKGGPINVMPTPAIPMPYEILKWSTTHFPLEELPYIQGMILEGIIYKTADGWPASRIRAYREFAELMRAMA